MAADGACPGCGQILSRPPLAARTVPEPEPEAEPKAPWHFKLLLVALVVYLGWRGFQGIEWVVQHV